jgi:hypothetical protein
MLDEAVCHLLPTSAARDWKSGEPNIMDRNARPLNEVITNLLPTPRAMDWSATPGAPGAARHVAAGNGSLPEVLGVYLMPTPSAADATGGRRSRSRQDGRGGELLLPGLLVDLADGGGGLPRSNDGSGSPDRSLTLWNWDDEATAD